MAQSGSAAKKCFACGTDLVGGGAPAFIAEFTSEVIGQRFFLGFLARDSNSNAC